MKTERELDRRLFDPKCRVDELRQGLRPWVKGSYKMNREELRTNRDRLNEYLATIPDYDYHHFRFGDKGVALNEEQYRIVVADRGRHMRIIACAGSGKSTTILCRIRFLIDSGVPARRILLMTFNVDACESLRVKLHQLFGFLPTLDVCTIDSFACRNYMKHLKAGHNYNVSLSEFSSYVATFMKSDAGKVIGSDYDYVFFDEFQDADDYHFTIVRQFAEYGAVVTVIGDDAQNIYTFRGTNVAYIMNFDRYVGEGRVDTHMLTINYRSTPEVIALANATILHNGDQIRKDMFPIKPSVGIRPSVVVLRDVRDVCRHVIDGIIGHRARGVLLDDIAVVARNNQPLKQVEEEVARHNRDRPLERITFVSLITDDNSDVKPKIQPDHITLTTVHKSKGLEWRVVYLVGVGDRAFPKEVDSVGIQEERRLFYVAVTRAKERLEIVASLKEAPITRFVSEVGPLIGVDNRSGLATRELFEYVDERDGKDLFTVTDVLKSLRACDIGAMRDLGILPPCVPTITTVYDRSYPHNETVNKYYLHPDFGEFVDRYLTRRLMEMDPLLTRCDDSRAMEVICSITETRDVVCAYRQHLRPLVQRFDAENGFRSLVVGDRGRFLSQVPDHLMDLASRIFDRAVDFGVLPHKIPVKPYGYLPNEFRNSMQNSYRVFSDRQRDTRQILRHVYNVSLCGNIVNDRRRLLYTDVLGDFTRDHGPMLEDVEVYLNRFHGSRYECKRTVYYAWGSDTSLAGEMDLLVTGTGTGTGSTLVDFKCSVGDEKVEWVVQMLLYVAMFQHEALGRGDDCRVTGLEVFNPMKGLVYRYDIAGWAKGEELLEFVYGIVRRERASPVPVPVPVPVQPPAQTPAQTPVQTPAQTPTHTPAHTPAQLPVPIPAPQRRPNKQTIKVTGKKKKGTGSRRPKELEP